MRLTATDQDSRTTTYVYDKVSQLVEVRDALIQRRSPMML